MQQERNALDLGKPGEDGLHQYIRQVLQRSTTPPEDSSYVFQRAADIYNARAILLQTSSSNSDMGQFKASQGLNEAETYLARSVVEDPKKFADVEILVGKLPDSVNSPGDFPTNLQLGFITPVDTHQDGKIKPIYTMLSLDALQGEKDSDSKPQDGLTYLTRLVNSNTPLKLDTKLHSNFFLRSLYNNLGKIDGMMSHLKSRIENDKGPHDSLRREKRNSLHKLEREKNMIILMMLALRKTFLDDDPNFQLMRENLEDPDFIGISYIKTGMEFSTRPLKIRIDSLNEEEKAAFSRLLPASE